MRAMTAYTTGAILSGALVGAAAGLAGSVLRTSAFPAPWVALGVAGVLLTIREIGVLPFPIPQIRRQTNKTWYHHLGPVTAAWWWGVDTGSGLTTIVTYSAYWLVVIAVLLHGSALYGALALGLYALGRSTAVLAPALSFRGQTGAIVELTQRLLRKRSALHRWHASALSGITLSLLANAILERLPTL
ncbi:MAG: hypothetical protein ACRDFX_12585 [Chloroflexota bacterium]